MVLNRGLVDVLILCVQLVLVLVGKLSHLLVILRDGAQILSWRRLSDAHIGGSLNGGGVPV
mgnify:CR=1 FL=1